MNMNIFGIFFLARIRIRIYSESYIGPNTNIFVMLQWTEYEYSNIFGSNIRIFLAQIFEYFWLKYSNIFGSNIWISFWTNLQIFHEIDRSQGLYSLNTKVTIILLSLSKLYNVAKLSPAHSKFNPVGCAELALILAFTHLPNPAPKVYATILKRWLVVKWYLSIQHLSKHHISRDHLSRLWLQPL